MTSPPLLLAIVLFAVLVGASLRTAPSIGGALAPAVIAGVGAFFRSPLPASEAMNLGSAPKAKATAPAMNSQTSHN